MDDNRGGSLCFETTPDLGFGDATFRATARSLQPLNGKLTPFSHLKVSNGARTSAVLNGASMALRLRPSLMVPKPYTLLLQLERWCKERHSYYLIVLLLYFCLKLSGNGYFYKTRWQG